MKNDNLYKIKFFLYLITFFNFNISTNTEKYIRGASGSGFFAEFLWVINHLEFCIAYNKTPVIYWGSNFAYYYDPGYNNSRNGWEYYFEPVSNLNFNQNDPLSNPHIYHDFSSMWYYCQYVENKHMLSLEQQKNFISIENHDSRYRSSEFDYQRGNFPVKNYHLYDPKFRKYIKEEIINKFINIKDNIKNKIEIFFNNFMAGKKTIGLHLRGKHIFGEVLYVPSEYLFNEANKYAQNGYQFFIATDQQPLINEAKKKLKGPVIYYDCQRFNETTSPHHGKKLDPKLGEDILIETILLSKCDHFIHTISNVSTTVLYFNPELTNTLIY